MALVEMTALNKRSINFWSKETSELAKLLRQNFHVNALSFCIEWFLYFLLTIPDSLNSASLWKQLMQRCCNKHSYVEIILKLNEDAVILK